MKYIISLTFKNGRQAVMYCEDYYLGLDDGYVRFITDDIDESSTYLNWDVIAEMTIERNKHYADV